MDRSQRGGVIHRRGGGAELELMGRDIIHHPDDLVPAPWRPLFDRTPHLRAAVANATAQRTAVADDFLHERAIHDDGGRPIAHIIRAERAPGENLRVVGLQETEADPEMAHVRPRRSLRRRRPVFQLDPAGLLPTGETR